MARAQCRVNQASEQALAHLFACHDAHNLKASSSLGFEVRRILSRCQEGENVSLESMINFTSILSYHDGN
jgi:hypothetical protein